MDGKAQGRWVWRYASGTVHEGPYVDGKRHGRWVIRSANGTVGEGPYVDGKRHGRWVIRSANGTTREIVFVNGKTEVNHGKDTREHDWSGDGLGGLHRRNHLSVAGRELPRKVLEDANSLG